MLYNMPLLSDRYTNAEFERNFFDQTGSRTAGLCRVAPKGNSGYHFLLKPWDVRLSPLCFETFEKQDDPDNGEIR